MDWWGLLQFGICIYFAIGAALGVICFWAIDPYGHMTLVSRTLQSLFFVPCWFPYSVWFIMLYFFSDIFSSGD